MDNVRKITVDCATGYITVAENIRDFLGKHTTISIHTEASGRIVRIIHNGQVVEIPDGGTLVLSEEGTLSAE